MITKKSPPLFTWKMISTTNHLVNDQEYFATLSILLRILLSIQLTSHLLLTHRRTWQIRTFGYKNKPEGSMHLINSTQILTYNSHTESLNITEIYLDSIQILAILCKYLVQPRSVYYLRNVWKGENNCRIQKSKYLRGYDRFTDSSRGINCRIDGGLLVQQDQYAVMTIIVRDQFGVLIKFGTHGFHNYKCFPLPLVIEYILLIIQISVILYKIISS